MDEIEALVLSRSRGYYLLISDNFATCYIRKHHKEFEKVNIFRGTYFFAQLLEFGVMRIMVNLTPKDIGRKLKQAGRLSSQPLCLYGTDTLPTEFISSTEINRCIARVIFTLAIDSTYSGVYISLDDKKECCPGGQAWLGFQPFKPYLKYFLSYGSQDFRNGSAEYLISDPDLVERRLKAIGKISPLAKFIIIQRSDQIARQNSEIKAFLCFGEAEQIRNLSSLAYFHSEKSNGIQIPWGPSCASFISYPAGMIELDKQNHTILGPTDPTGNFWFPRNFLSMGIPFKIAKQMAEDVDSSFIGQRPKIAYPKENEIVRLN